VSFPPSPNRSNWNIKILLNKFRYFQRQLNNIADVASTAELRDMHATAQSIHRELNGMGQNLREMSSHLQLHFDEKLIQFHQHVEQVLQEVIANKAITNEVKLDVQDIKPRIHDLQLSSILENLSPIISPECLLQKHVSFSLRKNRTSGTSLQISNDTVKRLEQWGSSVDSSLFILCCGPGANDLAKYHAVSVINFLRTTNYRVFWSLSSFGLSDLPPTITQILKGLVFQIIRQDSTVISRYLEELNAACFFSEHTEREWEDLLFKLLSRLDKCFMIIETEDLYTATSQDSGWPQDYINVFRRLVDKVERSGSHLKALVVNYATGSAELRKISELDSPFLVTIRRPKTVPIRMQHKTIRSKQKRFSLNIN
jgi:hypothetical protein